jgi:ubiquinone/menaquinone biosynthesis C-methylase UbiE
MNIDEAARYDRLAPFYDLAILPTQLLIGRRWRWLLRQAKGRVLEIGIGTGATLRLYPPDSNVVGLDVSQRMLERAGRRARGMGRWIPLIRATADQLPFVDCSFETVVVSLVLCSVADLATVMTEIKRVLAPGGRILMLEHIRPPGALGALFDRLDPFWYRQSCHLNRASVDEIERAGFRIDHQQRWLRGIFAQVVATVE